VDANLQRPYLLADAAAWPALDGAAWDAARRQLRLVGARRPAWVEAAAAAPARSALAPGALDRFGTRARVEHVAAGWRVVATGAGAGEVEIVAPQSREISDLVIGADDVLYLACGDRVVMHDLRGRWPDRPVAVAGGGAWRMAPAGDGGVWLLAAAVPGAAIGRVRGAPLPPLLAQFSPTTFRPRVEEEDPPRYERELRADAPIGGTPAAIACGPAGRLALVSWRATGDAELRVLGRTGWSAPITLAGVTRPYSLAWLDDDRVAVLIATATGTAVAVYAIPVDGDAAITTIAATATIVEPVGELYPLRAPTADPFVHAADGTPHYLSAGAAGAVPRALLPVSWPSFVATGTAAARPIDAEVIGTIWHRLYLEAALPPGTSARVLLAASDDAAADPARLAWYEHRFGDATDAADDVPRGAWIDAASEVPFHDGLLNCARRPGVAGLFTALIQRAGRRVRALVGRYLWVRVVLTGDGRASPELTAVRVYAGRRGYAGLYLPELYRDDVTGQAADEPAPATPADFLDRLLGAFESVLTPLEDRIAAAWLLTSPRRVPDAALEWLAGWLGFVFAADLSLARRRRMLEDAWPLYQQRGTLPGLQRALDLATGGAVTRGEVVVVEDFRLRRTFATILGADLGGTGVSLDISGNSRVGDTLVLGDEERGAVLALFLPELPIGDAARIAADEAAVAELFERLAHRVTVLVHQEVAPEDLGLIGQIVALEAPAHVVVKIVPATYRFRVAISALVGVDTFLAPKPAIGAVVVDASRVGAGDRIARLPSLDPRLGRSP
jgi:phage tail-like protein